MTTGSLPRLQTIIDALQAHAPGLADELATFIQGALTMKHETPIFRPSIKGESEASDSVVSLRVVSDDPLAEVKLEPTSAHEIYPVNAKALFWEGAAHPVMRVHHPGTVGLAVQVEALNERMMEIVDDDWALCVSEAANV